MTTQPIEFSGAGRTARNPRIAIAGCGFGGLALAIYLKKAGIESYQIYEKSAEPGGVWRDNNYPGAACDVPSRLYSYSFEVDYDWQTPFARQPQIFEYINYCFDKYGIAPHVNFNTEIIQATFDEAEGMWRLETSDGKTIEADVFVSAVGLFDRPILPDIPGIDGFAGDWFHAARWNHDVDLADKTVAVVGTGACAIQFVPKIAPAVKQLHVFQSSAQFVMPMRWAPPVGDNRSWLHRQIWWQHYERLKVFIGFEKGVPRRRFPNLSEKTRQAFLGYLETQVADPELRAKLTPDQMFGCKRTLQSNEYYPALQRPNVELIDAAVVEVTADGVRAANGESRKADVLIFNTGYDTKNYVVPMRVFGLDGHEINQGWQDGAEAYYGVSVSGFPNFFMMYGPNTNAGGSIIYMLERQAQYIVRCMKKLRRRRAQWMNVRADAQAKFNEQIQRALNKTTLAADGCVSYYRLDNGKVVTNWPRFKFMYGLETLKVRSGDYEFEPRQRPG